MMDIQQLIDAVEDEDIDTLRQFAAEQQTQGNTNDDKRTEHINEGSD